MAPRVLLVDDNALTLELLRQLLEDEFELLTAANGRQGVDLARSELPDAIVMDLEMPVLDGWGAIAELRRSANTRKIPVLALSGVGASGSADRALALGARAFVPKPIDEALLLRELRRLVLLQQALTVSDSSPPARAAASTTR